MPMKKSSPDFILIVATLSLLAMGLIMVYSASAIWATYKFNDSFFFAKRQFLFAGVGIVAMLVIMNIDYWNWKNWSKPILLICFALVTRCIDSWSWNTP